MDTDKFFEHYGIKGMRWGIRKDRPSTSKIAGTLTDKELKKRVKRLNMEKQYVDLVSGKNQRDASTLQKGLQAAQKQVAEMAVSVVKNQIKRVANDYMKDAIDDVADPRRRL